MKKLISIIILVVLLSPYIALAGKDSQQNERLDALEAQVKTLQIQCAVGSGLNYSDKNLTNRVEVLENEVINIRNLTMTFQQQIITIQKMLIEFINTITTKLRAMK